MLPAFLRLGISVGRVVCLKYFLYDWSLLWEPDQFLWGKNQISSSEVVSISDPLGF